MVVNFSPLSSSYCRKFAARDPAKCVVVICLMVGLVLQSALAAQTRVNMAFAQAGGNPIADPNKSVLLHAVTAVSAGALDGAVPAEAARVAQPPCHDTAAPMPGNMAGNMAGHIAAHPPTNADTAHSCCDSGHSSCDSHCANLIYMATQPNLLAHALSTRIASLSPQLSQSADPRALLKPPIS